MTLSNDGRWLSHHGGAGLDQDRSLPQGRAQRTPRRYASPAGKDFLYFAQPYNGDLYITDQRRQLRTFASSRRR